MAGGITGTPVESSEITPERTGGLTGLPVLLSEQVTLTVDDFIQPTGELYDSLYPEEDMRLLVDGWLQQAISLVEATTNILAENRNLAASAWVYYRAYSHIAQRLMASASTMSVDGKVSRSTASDQRQYYTALAAERRKLFDSFDTVAVAATPKPAVPSFFGTVKARRYVQ